jgi:prepilin-type N-terminal cleavage/methylation domain-containing protein
MTGLPEHRKTDLASARRRGLTLVELLAVMAILAILVGLIVGVGRYIHERTGREKTANVMAVIKAAVDSYYDVYNDYPPDTEGAKWAYHPNDAYSDDAGIHLLYMYLTGQHYDDSTYTVTSTFKDLSNDGAVKVAMDKISKLPTDTMSPTDHSFRDGFGRPMRYRISGGIGGKPLLTSAGADGIFNCTANPSTDDIRSDGRGN